MKRTKLLFSLLASAMMLIGVGCDPEPTPGPGPDPQPESYFKFEILSTEQTSVSFRITPVDTTTPYVAMIIDKPYFDQFDTDDDYIYDDLAWFEEEAMYNGETLEEYLSGFLKTGVVEDSTDGLTPNTEYYLYAYQLTPTGEILTDLEKVLFTTKDFDKVDVTFEVSVSDIQYKGATINVKPSKKDAIYFVNAFTQEQVEEWSYGGADAYKAHLVALRDYYLGMNATTDQMIANLCFVGDGSLALDDLKSGVKYYAYAIGVNDDFLPNTDAEVVEFTTLATEGSSLTFDVNISEVFYDHAEGVVTPSNNNEQYICSIQTAESLTWYDSEQDFMEAIIMDLEWWFGGVDAALHTGPTDIATLNGLSPETDYVVVCFGYDGVPTTRLFSFPFTTAEANGNPADLVVTFNIDPSTITYDSAVIEAIPSVGAYYFLSYISKDEYDFGVTDAGSSDAAIIAYANDEIDYGAYFFDCTRAEYLFDMGAAVGSYKMMVNQLQPSTEYLAYAVAVDMESGEIASSRAFVSDVFRTLDKVVSDAAVEFVFGKYYDGTELANLDPANFLNCKGYAVMPYKVEPTESAMYWYTGFFSGDYTEWGCTDDDIYGELITWGYDQGSEFVSLNRESGVAVLAYDEPFTFLGLAEDIDGNFGAGALEVVTLTREGVSPAQEFIDAMAQPATAMQKAAKGGKKNLVAPRKVEKTRQGAVRPGHNVKKAEPVATGVAKQRTVTPHRFVVGR